MDKRYNWKTSRDGFETFKYIYMNPGVSLAEITKKKGVTKSTITDQIKPFSDEGLIKKTRKGKEMLYQVNKAKLNKKIKISKDKTDSYEELLEPLICAADCFSEAIKYLQLLQDFDKMIDKVDRKKYIIFKQKEVN